MKRRVVFFIFILPAILIFLSRPTHSSYAQGFITCRHVGTQCFYFESFCAPSYMPPTGAQHGCNAYDGNIDVCNTVHIPCIQSSITPTPTSEMPPCGNLGQSCCGTIPPLYCSWPYVPSNNQDTLRCVCQQPSASPQSPPALPSLSPGSGTQPTECDSNGDLINDGIETAIGCIPTQDTTQFVGWLLGFVIKIAGGIAFLLIIFGAIKVLTSSGNPEAVKAGQEMITSALMGLLFIIFSLFLLELIGVKILNIPGFKK